MAMEYFLHYNKGRFTNQMKRSVSLRIQKQEFKIRKHLKRQNSYWRSKMAEEEEEEEE